MNLCKKHICLLAIAASFAACSQSGQVQLPSIFGDGMVVQRGAPVALWGTSAAGASIEAKVDGYDSQSTTADADGNWKILLSAIPAGGPYQLIVNGDTIHDVLCGDVLICSGQSNMELPLNRVTDMFADEIAEYQNPNIRYYTVPYATEFHGPLKDTKPSQWVKVSPDTDQEFSALAFFIAQDLYATDSVPVGLISACWGGTPIESWISEDSLASRYPYAVAQKSIYNDDAYRKRVKQTEGENYYHWNTTLDSSDPGMAGQKWYARDLDDSQWTEIDLFSTEWATDGLNPVNGSHWFRKDFTLTPAQASTDATLRLGRLIDADSVYVNGTFVGSTGYEWPPRIYNVPASVLKEGVNNVTVRLISQHGFPHFVAEKPYKLITSDGDIDLAGTWKYRLGTRMPKGPDMIFYHYIPAVLYNARIAPIIQYPVRAAVWYQGESNVERRNEYPLLLDLMISNWRDASGNANMPFYVVELADYLPYDDIQGRDAWAEMRQLQAAACDSIEGAYLIPNYDLGEWNDIHPLDKKTLGQRIATQLMQKP